MFYVLDENNNKVEAFDKQGVLALLEQAIADGTLENIVADSAFINKIKCCVGGSINYIAFITQATYNELAANDQLKENTYYFITDDTTAANIDGILDQLSESVNDLLEKTNDLEGKYSLCSKKANQRSYITSSYLSDHNLEYPLLYDSTLASNPIIDMSEIMGTLEDVDTKGISGSLDITVLETVHTCYFHTIWASENYLGAVVAVDIDSDNPAIIMFKVQIVGQTLSIVGTPKYFCLNTVAPVEKININNLNIYYR